MRRQREMIMRISNARCPHYPDLRPRKQLAVKKRGNLQHIFIPTPHASPSLSTPLGEIRFMEKSF